MSTEMGTEPNPESVHYSALSPPEGPLTGLQSIIWNAREFRAGWRLLIYVLFAVVVLLMENYLAQFLHLPQIGRTGITASSLLVQEASGVLAVFAAAGIMAMLEARPFGMYGLPRAGAFGARFWQGALWGIAMITAVVLLIRAFGGFSFGTAALAGARLWGYAALWLLVFLFVGLFEEFFFRGYAQFTLATGVGFWPAAVALSAGFAAIHIHNSGEDLAGAFGVFVIGMFFCLTLRRTGNLWFAVGVHAVFDWGETFLYSVPDSGIVAPGHLLNSTFHGPVWLTGGTVGPEASVMAFAVTGLAAILFVLVYPSQKQKT
jgi:membrane protease YdiL (CAAX protease family)